MLTMAKEMNGVATRHEHQRQNSRKQEFATNRTITFQASLNALMVGSNVFSQASITLVTVDVAFTSTGTTNTALVAMENLLLRIIIPKLAVITIIKCK